MSSDTTKTEQPFILCCGCNSRRLAIWINAFLIFAGAMQLIGGSTVMTSPDEEDHKNVGRVYFVLGFLNILVGIVAIWGACSFRLWPIQMSLGLAVLACLHDLIVGFATLKFGILLVGALRLTIFGAPQWLYVRELKKGILTRPGTTDSSEDESTGHDDEEEGNLQSPMS